jgi:hypothetical protein
MLRLLQVLRLLGMQQQSAVQWEHQAARQVQQQQQEQTRLMRQTAGMLMRPVAPTCGRRDPPPLLSCGCVSWATACCNLWLT